MLHYPANLHILRRLEALIDWRIVSKSDVRVRAPHTRHDCTAN